MRKLSKWKENILAVFIAALLSFVLYHVTSQYGLLSADIAGGPALEFNDLSDIVVDVDQEDILKVYAGKNMEGVESMSFIIPFDPTTVQLEKDSFRSSYDISYSPAGEGKGTVVLQNTQRKSISVKDVLFSLSVAGKAHDIVIGDVVANFDTGESDSLSVQLPR